MLLYLSVNLDKPPFIWLHFYLFFSGKTWSMNTTELFEKYSIVKIYSIHISIAIYFELRFRNDVKKDYNILIVYPPVIWMWTLNF